MKPEGLLVASLLASCLLQASALQRGGQQGLWEGAEDVEGSQRAADLGAQGASGSSGGSAGSLSYTHRAMEGGCFTLPTVMLLCAV